MLQAIAGTVLPIIARQLGPRGGDSARHRLPQRAGRRVRHLARHPEQIDRRLATLDAEWNLERALEAGLASVGLAGALLGCVANKRFLILTAIASGFLLQHAIVGWCPPSLVLRQLGLRSVREIERERYALKALRGDFRGARHGRWSARAERALQAVRT